MLLRLDPYLFAQLAARASAENTTLAELARRAITAFLGPETAAQSACKRDET
jgi:hypothetical protein